jgi:predicted nucleotidyltransferase
MPFPDYVEFIASLNEHHVKYLVVGAQALAYHARPRATKDLDLFIEPSPANAKRVLAALKEFFNADPGYEVEDLVEPGIIVQLGVAPVRIDIMTQIAGFSDFNDAWKNRVDGGFGAIQAHFMGLDDLIAAKQAANRPQDRADLHVLKKAREKRTKRG